MTTDTDATKPAAWMTLNEEGDPAMLFFDYDEACLYCEPDEKPVPLVRGQPS